MRNTTLTGGCSSWKSSPARTIHRLSYHCEVQYESVSIITFNLSLWLAADQEWTIEEVGYCDVSYSRRQRIRRHSFMTGVGRSSSLTIPAGPRLSQKVPCCLILARVLSPVQSWICSAVAFLSDRLVVGGRCFIRGFYYVFHRGPTVSHSPRSDVNRMSQFGGWTSCKSSKHEDCWIVKMSNKL